jgi:hypothetical protein
MFYLGGKSAMLQHKMSRRQLRWGGIAFVLLLNLFSIFLPILPIKVNAATATEITGMAAPNGAWTKNYTSDGRLNNPSANNAVRVNCLARFSTKTVSQDDFKKIFGADRGMLAKLIDSSTGLAAQAPFESSPEASINGLGSYSDINLKYWPNGQNVPVDTIEFYTQTGAATNQECNTSGLPGITGRLFRFNDTLWGGYLGEAKPAGEINITGAPTRYFTITYKADSVNDLSKGSITYPRAELNNGGLVNTDIKYVPVTIGGATPDGKTQPGTGSGGSAPTFNAYWDDIATIKTTQGHTYRKFIWNKNNYYFLWETPVGDPYENMTWNKTDVSLRNEDPFKTGTNGREIKSNSCVPFIEVPNLDINFAEHNSATLQNHIDRAASLGGAGNKNPIAYYAGDPGTCNNLPNTGAPITVAGRAAGATVDGPKIWMLYNKELDQFTPIFREGGDYEQLYLGLYTKNSDGYLSRNNTACPTKVTPGTISDTAPFNIKIALKSKSCSDDYGEISVYAKPVDKDTFNNTASQQPGEGGTAADQPTGCETSLSDPLSYIVCPVVNAASSAINTFDNAIQSTLQIQTERFNRENTAESGNKLYQIWSIFRYISTIFLVLAGLVMVLSQAFGFGVFEAYTIKKVLPRLLVAVIFMTFSWDLCRGMVELANYAGNGIRAIMYAPFGGADNVANGFHMTGFEVNGVALGVFYIGVGLGIVGLLSLALTGFLALLIAFALVVFREIIITLLIIIAPLAIAAYVLPNTEKLWKVWWETFSKLLIMFPLIMAFLASGRIIAYITVQSVGADNTGPKGNLANFISMVAYFAPYFLIPATFKFAGSIFSTISGMTNDKSKGAFDRLKKGRQKRMSENFLAASQNRRFNAHKYDPNSFRGRLVRGFNSAASIGTSNPWDTARIYAGTDGGKAILSQIDAGKFEATKKLAGKMGEMGISNDRALAALAGQNSAIGRVRTAADIKRAIAILNQGDAQDKIGASQLQNAYGTLANIHKDSDLGRASIEGAALMGWSQQGFASAENIAGVANSIGGGLGASIANEATYLGYSRGGRLDLKPSYGVQYDPDTGNFFSGLSTAGHAPGSTGYEAAVESQAKLVRGLKQHEITGAKSSAVMNMREGVKRIVEDGYDENRLAAFRATAHNQGWSPERIEDEVTARRGRAKAMLQNVAISASLMSTADPESKRLWQETRDQLSAGGYGNELAAIEMNLNQNNRGINRDGDGNIVPPGAGPAQI